jgi:hypothetical protein
MVTAFNYDLIYEAGWDDYWFGTDKCPYPDAERYMAWYDGYSAAKAAEAAHGIKRDASCAD